MGKKKKKEGPLPPRVMCPVCGGKGVFGDPGKDGLCECEGCGLIYAGSPPSRKTLALARDRRFAGAWDGAHDGSVRPATLYAQDVMASFFAHTAGMEAVLNGFDRNILDAFCGLGFRLREFQRYGWDVYGVDPGPEAVQYGQGCFLDVREAWFDEDKLPEVRFDLVLFAGGFSCLPDPVGAVKRLDKLLRPGGLVFVGLAGEPLSARLFHFDGETLRRVFMENGFQVLEEGERDSEAFAWFARKKDARESRKPALTAAADRGKEA